MKGIVLIVSIIAFLVGAALILNEQYVYGVGCLVQSFLALFLAKNTVPSIPR